MRIAIAIPHSAPQFDKEFVFSLLLLTEGFHLWNRDKDHKLKLFINSQGFAGIADMREKLAEEAIGEGYEYILWLDSDMKVPPGIIPKMLAWFEEHKDLEAVSGLYHWKKQPFIPHVYMFKKDEARFVPMAAFPLKQAFNVDGVGYGCLMIKTSVYARIEKPWFDFSPGEYGEDLYFFAKAYPINMICDPRIACNHLMQTNVSIGNYLEYNNLKVNKKVNIQITKEQVEKIDKENADNNRGGAKKMAKRSFPKKLIDKIRKK